MSREEIRKFVLRAAHDLLGPLRTIRVNCELLATADEAKKQSIQQIKNGVSRMEVLIRDVAEYCQTVAKEPSMDTTDLNGVLNDARGGLREELRRCKAVITNDPLPAVRADAETLGIALRNLIVNACRFRGYGDPRIHVGVRAVDSEWVFSVRDNGRGFDPSYRELIFEPFERLDVEEHQGSGLGLTHARKIVQQHGGRIWAESSIGEGSTFWFTLPAPSVS